MKVLIRQERPDDHELVEHVVKAAFEKAEFSDQKVGKCLFGDLISMVLRD